MYVRHTPFGCNICQTHIRSCVRRVAAHVTATAATRRLGISCLHACPHTRGKSGCEHANSYCSARLTLMLTPALTPTLTQPGSLPQPSPSKRLSRAQSSCR